jgi:hypothetical protein
MVTVFVRAQRAKRSGSGAGGGGAGPPPPPTRTGNLVVSKKAPGLSFNIGPGYGRRYPETASGVSPDMVAPFIYSGAITFLPPGRSALTTQACSGYIQWVSWGPWTRIPVRYA